MMRTRNSIMMLASILSLWAIATIATPANAAVVLYDIDFGTPPHTVGSPPATGGGPPPRDTVTSINFGNPTVVSSLGTLTDQPLEFDSFDGGDQVELDLSDLPLFDFYTTEVEVLIETRTAGGRFVILHDTTQIRNIEFIDGVISVFVPGVTDPLPGTPIGNYTPGVPILVRAEIDLAADNWEVFLDNILAHSGSFGGATEIVMVRFSTDVVPLPPGTGTLAGIDNVIITGVAPTPARIRCSPRRWRTPPETRRRSWPSATWTGSTDPTSSSRTGSVMTSRCT